ncbi:MAG: roadblock/LC7 domain-containing protein [Promethearchaeota archaeon]
MFNITEKEIYDILKKLREQTGIINSMLFTQDGFIIAIDIANFNEDGDYFQSIAAICAGVISLAENGLTIIKNKNCLKQIKIQAGNQIDDNGFMIILQSITNEVMMSVLFPIYLNLGVVLFELNQTIYKLGEYLSTLTKTDNFDKMGNLVKLL